jgi:hypothetical protein
MAENIAPRQILRDLLQGNTPPRPLFVPIVFALGARVENLSPRAFLGNPTKISNALRQIRGPLRSDGVSCYFDPLLEVEALGGTVEWASEHKGATVRWPAASERGQLPAGLASPDDAVKRGRVPVALEVIRRLKALLREDSLLMAGVSGPFTLAARLSGLLEQNPLTREVLPDSALEVANLTILQISKAFAEAGANLVFLREEILPILHERAAEEWTSMLAPIFNVIRFYEGLPVLQIANDYALAGNSEVVLRLARDCVICPTLEAMRSASAERSDLRGAKLGVGLSASAFQQDQHSDTSFDPSLGQAIRDLRPALVTTAEDVPPATDLKRLAAISEVVRRSWP